MLTTCPVCRLVRAVGNAGMGAPCPQHAPPLDPYRVVVRRGVARFVPANTSGRHTGALATALVTLLFVVAGVLSAREVATVKPIEPQVPGWVLEPEPAREVRPVPKRRGARAADGGGRR